MSECVKSWAGEDCVFLVCCVGDTHTYCCLALLAGMASLAVQRVRDVNFVRSLDMRECHDSSQAWHM